ncbi:hypothetical protein D6833_08690 [Candidatus Parcubacteria bacterium]|nr:MAG: hypothetical protein D6833_08690 [Candidatus Parcubacteria bacterium]
MKLLVTVLGRRPSQYVKVLWRVGDVRYHQPCGPPARALVQHERVTHALLVIPDSLIEPQAESDLAQEWAIELDGYFEPLVLPSRYAPRVEGNVLDFYYAALFHFADWFRKHTPAPEQPLTVVLEGSTGLNVLQLLLYRAVLDFTQALAYTREVELKVYTADPVNEQMAGRDVALYLTESRPVIPALPRLDLQQGTGLLLPSEIVGRDYDFRAKRDELGRHWHWDDLRAFLAAVYQGIPLGILTWYPTQAEAAWKVLDELYKYACRKTESHDGKRVRQVELTEWWRAYALGMLLATELQTHFGEVLDKWKQRGLATLQDLGKLVDRLYRHTPVLRNRFRAERAIRGIDVESVSLPAFLADIMRGSAGQAGKAVERRPDKRNFFAHMGFERNAVEVDLIPTPDSQIGFRYSQGSEKTIQKLLRNSI